MQKIFTRTVVGADLFNMLQAANVNRNEFIRLTGFTAIDIDKMLNGDSQSKRPRMSDLIVLRVLAEIPAMKPRLLDLSDEYHEGEYNISTSRHVRRAQQFGNGE